MTTLPLWIWFAGVIALGAVLGYGILRNRTRTSRDRAVSDQATKELYKQEDRSANSTALRTGVSSDSRGTS